MRQSKLFSKISRELPKDEASFNAQILIRAGFIDKVAAGIYTFLPLGLRVHNKICNIVREEMNAIGGQEILMPGLTPKEVWETTGRWATFDALFRLSGSDKKEYALGATHEEIVTPLVKKHVFSYKELPTYVYQVQTKFRNEKRAKAGLIRGREFSMKDLYSFHETEEDLNEYYKIVQKAYFKIFERCGLLNLTYLTFASGGAFSKYSHEFQTVTEAGEDQIFICEDCQIAINQEIIEEQKGCPNCEREDLKQAKAVEVGNIFKLRTKFSDAFNLNFKDKDGEEKIVEMGCYGIGPSRVMATIVETSHDAKGIIWPEEVAPFKVHLLKIGQMDESSAKKVESIYKELLEEGIEVLFDDREVSAGEKFISADLIGCPYRLVISEKTLNQNKVEVKKRSEDKLELVSFGSLIKYLKK
ncbi:MAG: Proline-tRNA ligase [Parcubacteria group bacterium GW2011_GWE2_38_18]|nr:MAG: Proline-tRNA ligase [Parcubacteria group bacterium GW2011_GWE2_38_18]